MEKFNLNDLYIGTIIKNVKEYRVGNRVVVDGEPVRGNKKTIFVKISQDEYLRVGNQKVYKIAKGFMLGAGILENGFTTVKKELNCSENTTLTAQQIMQIEELYNENKQQAVRYLAHISETERDF